MAKIIFNAMSMATCAIDKLYKLQKIVLSKHFQEIWTIKLSLVLDDQFTGYCFWLSRKPCEATETCKENDGEEEMEHGTTSVLRPHWVSV